MSLSPTRSDAELAAGFDLFALDEGYFAAPHVWHRRLREHDPVHRNSDGTVLLTRYADIREVWRDRSASVDKADMFRAKFGEGPLLEHHTTSMLFRDPPDHDRLSAIVAPFFATESARRFEPFLDELIDGLVDEIVEMGEFDAVTDFAAKVPIAVITRLLGVPPGDGDYLRGLGLGVLFPLNPHVPRAAIDAGHAAAAEFAGYVTDLLHAVRRRWDGGRPASLIEALVAAERTHAEISEAEIVHMCILTLNGGHETTTNLIAGGIHALLDHPSQFAALGTHGAEIRSTAVEELIRFVSPLQLQGRRLTRDLSLEHGELSAGTEVILCQASANRDDAVFARPDVLDLRRRRNAHLAFGLGQHLCPGRRLARVEAGIALTRLAQRLPRLQRAGRPEFNPNARFRGLKSLPLATGTS